MSDSQAMQTLNPDSARPLDPNVLQRRASNPEASVWVNASAGTGKTKVLTDRVLRLLLPRENGAPGTLAHKILCLTFTKAAASEMALRISKTLSSWAVIDETALHKTLKNLLGRTANAQEIDAARKLFADVVDVPGGLKIMTIHSFCQSVLGRFPLEAGINPNFKALEESGATELLMRASHSVFQAAEQSPDSPLNESLRAIGRTINEDQFQSLLHNIVSERHQLKTIQAIQFKDKNPHAALCNFLKIHEETTAESLLTEMLDNAAFDHDAIKNAALTMLDIGTKTDIKSAENILHFLSLNINERKNYFETYKSSFLKADGDIKAKLAGKAVCEHGPEIPEILTAEAQRIISIKDHLKRIEIAAYTANLISICSAVLEEYDALKSGQGALDFDDLILKTLTLLKGRSTWVQYKLDQGLEHILVDEAQDTNPEQWQIIEALCDDFFTGESAQDKDRSVFVVGDEKQSIYSFQRASPEEFTRMQAGFAEKIKNANAKWNGVDLNISFRSTQGVLNAVDAAFALSENPTNHISFRQGQAGQVEIWPLSHAEDPASESLWEPPIEVQEQENAGQKLAASIAASIKKWIDEGEVLPSRNRVIRPEDIMILVRTRGALVEQIIRALKNLNVPVNGADRMILSSQIAVQDMLAAAKFALNTKDDLTLACLLKSPLIGVDEDTLFELSHAREGSLYESVQKAASAEIKTYLETLLNLAKTASPFGFFSALLQTPCPADSISGKRAFTGRLGNDAIDPLEELLRLALDFKKTESTSLQHFIAEHDQGRTEIKREGEQSGGAVRIMTVHGAKGLQAPIVILPDTTSTPKSAPIKADKRLLWPAQTGLPLPLWSPRKDSDADIFKTALEKLSERFEQEYRRLLYVAMTRAEDRLILCGQRGKKDPADECWYNIVSAGFRTLETATEDEAGNKIYKTAQTRDGDRIENETTVLDANEQPLPAWITAPAPKEHSALSTLRPSQITEIAASPLSGLDTKRFLRGNLTHKLLQILPDIPPELWESKAQSYLAHYGDALPDTIQADIIDETLNILNASEFSEIFGPGSLAEVPITGIDKTTNQPISGQIDRLLITPDEILIIDFKSNRPPPKSERDIPQIYRDQMRIYAQTLQDIYSGRTVKCALLWTDGPILMPLEL